MTDNSCLDSSGNNLERYWWEQMKVLIVAPHMIAGGVERALLGMLDILADSPGVETTLLLAKCSGELLGQIPSSIKVLEIPMDDISRAQLFRGGFVASMKFYVSRLDIISAGRLAWRKLIATRAVPEVLGGEARIPRYQDSFDLAIAYHMHMPFLLEYVTEKVSAQRKYAWVHNDLAKSGFNLSPVKSLLRSMDGIFAVSAGLVDELRGACPEIASKITLFPNISNPGAIFAHAFEEDVDFDPTFGGVKVLSMCRLDRQKGIDIALRALRLLKDRKLPVRWYFLGEGRERRDLEALRERLGLAEDAIFLGAKTNPYPYVRVCDIYAQTSRHEGLAVAVQEAKILGKPILVTDVAGLRESVIDGLTGLVVGCSPEDIARGIGNMIASGQTMDSLARGAKNAAIDNGGIEALAKLLGNGRAG